MMLKIGTDSDRVYTRGCYHAIDGRVVFVDMFGSMYLKDNVGRQACAQELAKLHNQKLIG